MKERAACCLKPWTTTLCRYFQMTQSEGKEKMSQQYCRVRDIEEEVEKIKMKRKVQTAV